ncbi:hypothetical protein [Sorangium sp. So ce1099]|uniref:hypothetical protein n=1 Tax=Sorangium sp. So ce1099 TaxID=3133331 RepID=UPI003F5F0439
MTAKGVAAALSFDEELSADGMIVGDPTALGEVAPCEGGAEPRECARRMVVAFGARAYRAPLMDAAGIERHLQLFSFGAETSYEHGIELLADEAARAVAVHLPRTSMRPELQLIFSPTGARA